MVTPSRAQWCANVNSKTHLSEMLSTVTSQTLSATSLNLNAKRDATAGRNQIGAIIIL